jgi:hemerythrin-like domain-containing protein
MLPVGQLMIEHRLIERMIRLWKKGLDKIENANSLDVGLITQGIDFMQMYADRCHHGKEEDILFRALKSKSLSAELAQILQELINEHNISRDNIRELTFARQRYLAKDKSAFDDIHTAVKAIVELYPEHILKEDKCFFLPCMEYFTTQEKENMILEFKEFDRNLIHEKYKSIVKEMESGG